MPNYWGHHTPEAKVVMTRCPLGYCCPKGYCERFNNCTGNRAQQLCGRCKPGYSEALFSKLCVPDSKCDDWIVALLLGWIFSAFFLTFFFSDIKDLLVKLKDWFKNTCWRWVRCKKVKAKVSVKELEKISKFKISQEKLTYFEWEFGKSEDHSALSKAKKYFQIIAFYIQDSALLQVELPITEDSRLPFREWMFFAFQWAFDLYGWGKEACLVGLTPVKKLFLTSSVGPVVLFLYLIVYLFALIFTNLDWKKKIYCGLTSGSTLALLVFYQSIASASLSSVYCIRVGNQKVLHFDGTIQCYQPWQIVVVVFIFSWVLPFVAVLATGPRLLAKQKITLLEFVLSCAFPVLLLICWIVRKIRNQWEKQRYIVSNWDAEAVESLQKSFKDIKIDMTFARKIPKLSWIGNIPISWNGVIKARRLFFVILFTWVPNLILRVSLMIASTFAFFLLHTTVNPYQDNSANYLFSFSLVASISLGVINLVKATFSEILAKMQVVQPVVETCEHIIDAI